jgi:type I restriction enzyme S subunit
MIRTTNVRDGFIDTDNVRYVDEATFGRWTRRAVPLPGDVVLTREAPLGEVGIIRKAEPVFLGQRTIMYRAAPEKLDPYFLMYSMLGDFIQGQIRGYGSGSTVEHMRLPDCFNLQMPLPPLRTQRKIAAVLAAYDELIENNTRRIRILEEMARRIYREWFVDFRYPGHEAVPLVESDLGPIPEGWTWTDLQHLATETRVGVDPASVDPDTPYIGLAHMPEHSIAISEWGAAREASSRKYEYKQGQILFGKIRPYFHKVVVPPVDGLCSTDAIVISSRTHVCWGLVLAIVSSDAFVAEAVQGSQGTKMPRANWSVLERLRVAVPDDALMSIFDSYMRQTVDLIHSLVMAGRNLRATRDVLLPRLISGDVDVSDLEIAILEPAA